eukprot:g722.t1
MASKLKNSKKQSSSERKAVDVLSRWDGYSVDFSGDSTSSRRSFDARTSSSRSVGKGSQLDSAYMPEASKSRSKQRRRHSELSESSLLDSFESTTPRSLADSTTSSVACSKDSDSVKVLVRIRPPSAKELKEENLLSVHKTSDASLQLVTNEGHKNFAFDAVIGDDVSQSHLFTMYAANIVERCLSGYNGCIFAYGQTGSGKTYTMLGDVSLREGQLTESTGIIPRVFKHLFETLEDRREAEATSRLEFDCKCSFLEIYNETITDLLNPTKKNLLVREDKSGTHAAGLTEQKVASMEEALKVIHNGTTNRSVAHTQMNAESSRSHSILTCTLTMRRQNENGCSSVFTSRLNLVDLAGSERQKSTGTTGSRLKEASGINKSLSTLGLVILSLADTKSGKTKHVPYRDSKLTFLLQDSLGGNANAVMISNVSPSTKNINETLSTLRFATGAKKVKNKAVANHDFVGSVSSLKAEITLLKQELKALREKTSVKEEDSDITDFEKTIEICTEDSVQDIQQESEVEQTKPKGLDNTLASALKREDAAHRTVIALSEEILLLQSALEIKESEIRKHKLITKFKDDKIQRLEELLKAQSKESWPDESEIQRLKEELEFFKERANRASDATRYAYENMQLKHELATLKWSLDVNHSKAKFDEQIMELRGKLLEVNEEIKRYQGPDSEELRAKADESAMEVVKQQSDKLECLMQKSKARKQKREEMIARYVSNFTLWAKSVVGTIAKPFIKLNSKIKECSKV